MPEHHINKNTNNNNLVENKNKENSLNFSFFMSMSCKGPGCNLRDSQNGDGFSKSIKPPAYSGKAFFK